MTYENVTEVFEKALPERFKSAAAKGEREAYHFTIKDGGHWCVKIDDGALQITSGDCAIPAGLTLSLSAQDMLDLVNGKEGIQLLFMTGRLRIEGDLPTAYKLVKFFPA